MKRNTLLLATALISAAIAGPVFAQGASGGNPPTGVASPGTAAPQATTAPTNTGTTGVAPTGSATTGTGTTGTAVTGATPGATATSPTAMMPRGAAVVTPIDPMKIDQMALRQGMRTSKVVGMTVVNSANETLGTIDDLIVMQHDTVTYAVLSVGGFLGMGAHYVVVPYSSLEAVNKQMRLPNASKESLKALPSYSYPA